MYNAENSKPRKGFGVRKTHKCAKCGHEMTLAKLPFMMECSGCHEPLRQHEILEIKRKDNE